VLLVLMVLMMVVDEYSWVGMRLGEVSLISL
jgi:hypothetical protein